MDIKDKLLLLAERVEKLRQNAGTEEATKTSFVLPFIQMLGYDIFNPKEVSPECDCDYGTKKGEKIDYTIYKDNEPVILVECKHWKEDLSKHKAQLFRYFTVSNAKFCILTNGVQYQFYTDIDEPNRMDNIPFLDVNILDLKDSQIEKIKEFHKDYFSVDSILTTANELKYINAIRSFLVRESENTSEEFARFLVKQVYPGSAKKSLVEQFQSISKKAFSQFINDYVNFRLKSAIITDVPPSDTSGTTEEELEEEEKPKIITTEEELQGFYIVRAILCPKVEIERIVYRDAQTYFSILLDDNNRKPICRLHFNRKKKYVETFDLDKVGTKHLIESPNDIYQLSNLLIETVGYYTLL